MEMEPYYDSDEGIAWGPLTLKEIKRELSKKPKRVLHRQTAIGSCDYSTDLDSQSNASTAASAYFTPDESIQPVPSVNKNEIFLEQLTKVIDNDSDSLYTTAMDTTNAAKCESDTLLRILKAQSQSPCDLENFHQTLVENTLLLSPDKKTPHKTAPIMQEISEDEQSYSDLDDVIVISDNSSEDLSEPENIPVDNFIKSERRSKSPQLQNFNNPSPQNKELEDESSGTEEDLLIELNHVREKLAELNSDSSSFSPEKENWESEKNRSAEINNSVTTEESLCEEMELPNSDTEDLQIVSSDVEDLQISCTESEVQEKLHDPIKELAPQQKLQEREQYLEQEHEIEEKMNLLGLEANQPHFSRVTSPTSNSPKDLLSLETSDQFLENPAPSLASTASEDSFNKSESLTFNDTLEEMDMALRQGLDYVMPGEQSVTPQLTRQAPSNLNCQLDESAKSDKKKPIRTPTSKKYDHVQSLVGEYIRKKSPSAPCDNFKLPMKPPKCKLTPNHSPLIQTKPYRSIVSPVGVYIKNSPGVVLKKNVTTKPVPSLNIFPITEAPKSNKENVSSGLPSVVYKPASKVVITDKKDIVLPPSIKKLVPEPLVTKHENRINRREIRETSVNRRLLEEADLTSTTVDCSLMDSTDGDMSFLTTKQAFIK